MDNKINEILIKLTDIENKFYQKLSDIENKFDQKLSNIENRFDQKIFDCESKENLIAEIIPKEFILDTNFIKSCLEENNIKYDMDLLKKMYFTDIDKEYYPIKYNSQKKIQYWLDDKWNNNNKYLFDTLIQNIRLTYLLVNNYDNYNDNIDQFMKNQIYITELSNEKYKDKLSKMLKALLEKL